jgi:hypothetical protein
MSAPAVAVSRDGKRFVAAWKDVRAGEPNVFWSISDKPSFANDSMVHDETRGVQDHPSVTFDDSAIAWVAWEDARSGRQRIYARTSSDDSLELAVSDAAEGVAAYPVIAAGGGLVVVAYEAERNREVATRLRVLFRRAGGKPPLDAEPQP